MTCSILLTTLCIWASVQLSTISSQTCRIETSKLQRLWYLNGSPGHDLNVLPAWRSCINGTGVTVGVVDRGVQDHIDLDIDRSLDGGRNRQEYLSQDRRQRLWNERQRYNYNYGNQRGISRSRDYQRWMSRSREDNLKHGTRVAGIIAAKYNDIGTTGIAFGAKIADIRIASSAVFETFNARLLNHRYNDIDVYSCSFANFHTGTKSYPLREEQKNALEDGTSMGRGGRGSVYVFGTGNSGGEGGGNSFSDSCAYDRLVTNRFVISVAGIQHNLQKLPSGEECAAMLVSAFTASPGSRYPITTTDVRNRTTTYFNQNSAAVPMVSGAVALALSVNEHLGYRDIMHLLVKTSRSNLDGNGFSSQFIANAAGLRFSSTFGFGLLDAGSLVESSKTWRNVPLMQQCAKTEVFNTRLQRENNNLVIHVSSCAVIYIEHVEVTLRVHHPKAGQLKWVLISPYGTRSTILPGRILDQTVDMDLTVLTVQLWGENPIGYWKLEPSIQFDRISLDHGTLHSATLTIYGTTCGVLQCLQPARQDVGNSNLHLWSEWSQCSVTCGHGYQTRQTQCAREICVGQRIERKTCNPGACHVRNQADVSTNPSCPSVDRLTSVCAEECSSDRECYGGGICCNNGCGHSCIWPASETRRPQVNSRIRPETRRPQVDSRIRPDVSTNPSCPSVDRLTSVCAEECSSDRECYGGRICCYNGCGHTCIWPASETRRPQVDSRIRPETRRLQVDSHIRPGPGTWYSWSIWSPCSKTCGQGTQTRTRSCSGGNCIGNYSDTVYCNNGNCPTCTDTYQYCEEWIRKYPYSTCPSYCRKTCGLC